MRSSSLWNRLKAVCNFLIYGKSNVQLMTCGKCNRICITTISSRPLVSDYITESKHIDLYWAQLCSAGIAVRSARRFSSGTMPVMCYRSMII